MKDIKLTRGDIDLIAGKDIYVCEELDALATMVQTVLMGNDFKYDEPIKKIMNRTSIRQRTPTQIAEEIKTEIERRIQETNGLVIPFITLDIVVSDNKDYIQVIVRMKNDDQILKTVEFIGDIFDGHREMNFSETNKLRW